MSYEVGIWNEGVSGSGDYGVWISADVKNGFSIGLFGDTAEEFTEVLKCWDMVLGTDLVVGAGLVDGNAIHHMEVISSVENIAVLNVWLELILTVVLFL